MLFTWSVRVCNKKTGSLVRILFNINTFGSRKCWNKLFFFVVYVRVFMTRGSCKIERKKENLGSFIERATRLLVRGYSTASWWLIDFKLAWELICLGLN